MASYADLKKALSGGSVGSALGAAAAGKKKKGGGFFSEKWSPPRTYDDEETGKKIIQPSEPIAFIRGDHRIKARTRDGERVEFDYPFWIYYDHYNASKGVKRRSVTCSGGLIIDLNDNGIPEFEAGDDPCIPCYYIKEEGAGGSDGWLSHRKTIVFTCVVLKWFHTKKVDKKTEFKECTGRRCKLCEKGIQKQFGRRVFWPMGPIWAEYILEKNNLLQNSCGCGGEVEYLGFTCPECSNIIRDFEFDEPQDGEIEQYRENDITCPKCNETIRAHAELDCSECGDPKSIDLWSVVMKPRRIGEKYTPDLESWRPMKENEAAAVAEYKPIDFSKFLSPAGLDDQAKWYGLKNPFIQDNSGSSEW